MAITPQRAPGRPVDPAKRQAMVAAAWDLFLAQGVEAVGMEVIAKRAGVSKVTLYRHFADKAALLEAGVIAEMERIEAAQRHAGADGLVMPVGGPVVDVSTRLRQFGLGIMHFLATDNAVAFYATLAGELRRHPELAGRFWSAGPGRTRDNLIQLLRVAAERGEIEAPDPELAAEQLFGLWQGFTNLQYALGVSDEVGIARRVDAGVELFLRAHRHPTSKP